MKNKDKITPLSRSRKNDFINDSYMSEAVVMVREKREERKKSKQPKVQTREEFLGKKRTLADIPFLPNENFGIAMTIIFLPYTVGVIFLFFYAFDASFSRMMKVAGNHSFFLVWAIGYELIAVTFILWVFKMLLFSVVKKPK